MKIKLSPSLERADLLNMGAELQRIENSGCAYVHYDVCEPRMYGTTKLSPDMLPMIIDKYHLTLDIHLLTPDPECLLPVTLPYVKGNYMTIYPESTFDASRIVKMIKAAGGKVGISLFPGSSLSYIEELIPFMDILTLVVRDIQITEETIHPATLAKITKARKMLDDAGRTDCEIAVDGSLKYEDIKPVIEAGANVLILGRKTAFKPGKTVDENLADVKKYVQDLGYEI